MEGGRLEGESWCHAMKNWLMFLINEDLTLFFQVVNCEFVVYIPICNEARFADGKVCHDDASCLLKDRRKERGDRTFPNQLQLPWSLFWGEFATKGKFPAKRERFFARQYSHIQSTPVACSFLAICRTFIAARCCSNDPYSSWHLDRHGFWEYHCAMKGFVG